MHLPIRPRHLASPLVLAVLLAGLPTGTPAAAAAAASSESSKVPTKPKKAPTRVAGAHIVIGHKDAERKPPETTRTREEALARAREALSRARAKGSDWAKVVTEFSDDPNAGRTAGRMGTFQAGQLAGPFQALGDALFGMEIGQVSDIVESPYGFHVLMRLAIVEYAASHILIQYKGSERARSTVTRSKEEAKTLATKLTGEAKAAGADFAAIAKENSDGPTASRGGYLGIFEAAQMVSEFTDAVAKLQIGEITGPVETAFGFHVIRREKIDRVGASHVLIAYQGATRANPSVTRTKEEARALAEKVTGLAKATGADFAAIAKEHSDGPSGPRGGVLGVFGRGQMTAAFEKAAFGLKVGEIAGPVETPFGFHVILRTE